jgi:hypothetical protein
MPNAPARFRAYVPASENAWPQRKKRKRSSDPCPGSAPLRTPPAQADPRAGSRRTLHQPPRTNYLLGSARLERSGAQFGAPGQSDGRPWQPLCAPAFKGCCIAPYFLPHDRSGSISAAKFNDRHGRTCFNTGRQGTQPLYTLLIDAMPVATKGKHHARSTSVTGRHGRWGWPPRRAKKRHGRPSLGSWRFVIDRGCELHH